MRGVKIHGLLLVLVLLLAFQTWTRERPTDVERERVLVWQHDTTDLVAIAYRSEIRDLDISRRVADGDSFLWGVEVVRPAPSPGGTPGADTLRFPLGAQGTQLASDLSELRVLRDLGVAGEGRVAELGLDAPVATLRVRFEGTERELLLGRTSFGGSDRYALDPESGRVLVLSAEIVTPLELGSGALRERQLHVFSEADILRVRVQVGQETRVMLRTATGPRAPGAWNAPESPGRPDPAFANFMDRVAQLAIQGFDRQVPPGSLDRLMRVEYLGVDDTLLGFLELFQEASSEGGAYFLLSERTRVPAEAVTLLAERVVRELPQLF